MSRIMRLFVAAALVVATIGAAGPAAAQGDHPFIVSWIGGGTLIGAPGDSFVAGQDYEVGDEVELYLNGVYHSTTFAEPNAEGTATPGFDVTVVPGDEVTLVRLDDGLTRSMIVAEVSITSANAATDVVTGFAAPGAAVVVIALPQNEFGTESVYRFVTADSSGQYVADFSVPGPTPEEQSTIDLLEGGLGASAIQQADGNTTALFWATGAGASEPSSKNDCKRGGWESLTDANGTPFKNQGDCVSYVATGGSNPANG